jgi:signal transduction histidine kinase
MLKIFSKIAYVPLTLKMLIITLLVGAAIWFYLDKTQTEKINRHFIAELDTRLSHQGHLDKFLFNRHITLFKYTPRQITSLKSFLDYIDSDDWLKPKTLEVKEYRSRPPWFPKRSVMRSLAVPKYALLLDSNGTVRERYLRDDTKLPAFLYNPSKHLIQLTHNQSYITLIEDVPYILSSEKILSSEGILKVQLMLVSPIDNQFLERSQQSIVSTDVVVLFNTDPPLRVIASSRHDLVPVDYRITDLEFIEYGGSDFRMRFVTLLSAAEVNRLTDKVKAETRFEILLSSLIYVIAFAILMFFITRQIKMLTKYVTAFEIDELKRSPVNVKYKDELYVLKFRFINLIEEVRESRKDLQNESEELQAANEELDNTNKELRAAIDDYVRAEKEKERIWHQLLQSQKLESVGRFTNAIVHDFKSYLTTILGFTGLAMERLKDDADLTLSLGRVQNSAEKALKIVKKLLLFSHSQSKEDQAININNTIDSVSYMFDIMVKKNIDVSIKAAPDIDKVIIDESQIEQVLLNLITNANHAMPNGGKLTITTENVFLTKEDVSAYKDVSEGDFVLLSVEDTGVGMDKDMIDKIFDPFFTTKRKGEGSGLGLSTVFGIVRQHRGFIYVDSEPGVGTSIKIFLPALKKLT